MPLTDNHVHVGWYLDGYHRPQEVWRAEQEAGVGDIVVSSTSTCAELYKQVVKEMCALKRLGGEHVHPVLWLTPKMLRTYGLRAMMRAKFRWEGVGIHPEAHKAWATSRKLTRQAVAVAQRLGVPLIVHTGNFACSEAKRFEYLLQEFPAQKFVFAHGRPTPQCVELLGRYGNLWVDTAFMDGESLRTFLSHGLCERLLFGTDAPINRYYDHTVGTAAFIRAHLQELRRLTTEQ